MQPNKMAEKGHEQYSSIPPAFMEGIAQHPSLDVIGNNLLAKHGLPPMEWLRYFQLSGVDKWTPVPEAEMQAYRDRHSPRLRTTCGTTYAGLNVEGEPLTAPQDTYY